jgi:hypothetical protein
MGVEARIIGTWTAIFSIIGAVIGLVSARVMLVGILIGGGGGAVFGLFSGVMVAIEHWNAVRKITNEVSEEALGAAHTRTLYLPLPYVSAFKLAEETLRVITTATLYRADIERGDLGASIKLPANRGYRISHVRMKLIALDEGRTEISVDVRPASASLASPDFGRNLDIVQRITRFLESVSAISTEHHYGV